MKRAGWVLVLLALASPAPGCVHRADGTRDVYASVARASRATCAAIGPTAAIGGTVAALVSREASTSADSPQAWITRGAALAAALCGAVVALFHAPKVETPTADPDASAGSFPDASADASPSD